MPQKVYRINYVFVEIFFSVFICSISLYINLFVSRDELFTGEIPFIVTSDSLYYRALAIVASNDVFSLISNAIADNYTHYNWVMLPTVGAVLVNLFGDYFDHSIIVINSILIFFILSNYRKVLIHYNAHRYVVHLYVLALLFPVLIQYTVSFSKEIPSIFVVSAITLAFVKKRYIALCFLAAVAFLIRPHYVAIVVILLCFWKFYWGLISLFAVSFLPVVVGREMFGATEAIIYDDRISSIGWMLNVNQIAEFPFGFFLAAPIRWLANLSQPVFPSSVIEAFVRVNHDVLNVQGLIFHHFSGAVLFIVFSFLVYEIIKNKRHFFIDVNIVIIAFLFVIGLIVFLHPRYYFVIFFNIVASYFIMRSYRESLEASRHRV